MYTYFVADFLPFQKQTPVQGAIVAASDVANRVAHGDIKCVRISDALPLPITVFNEN